MKRMILAIAALLIVADVEATRIMLDFSVQVDRRDDCGTVPNVDIQFPYQTEFDSTVAHDGWSLDTFVTGFSDVFLPDTPPD